jgi:hypothetical protein
MELMPTVSTKKRMVVEDFAVFQKYRNTYITWTHLSFFQALWIGLSMFLNEDG